MASHYTRMASKTVLILVVLAFCYADAMQTLKKPFYEHESLPVGSTIRMSTIGEKYFNSFWSQWHISPSFDCRSGRVCGLALYDVSSSDAIVAVTNEGLRLSKGTQLVGHLKLDTDIPVERPDGFAFYCPVTFRHVSTYTIGRTSYSTSKAVPCYRVASTAGDYNPATDFIYVNPSRNPFTSIPDRDNIVPSGTVVSIYRVLHEDELILDDVPLAGVEITEKEWRFEGVLRRRHESAANNHQWSMQRKRQWFRSLVFAVNMLLLNPIGAFVTWFVVAMIAEANIQDVIARIDNRDIHHAPMPFWLRGMIAHLGGSGAFLLVQKVAGQWLGREKLYPRSGISVPASSVDYSSSGDRYNADQQHRPADWKLGNWWFVLVLVLVMVGGFWVKQVKEVTALRHPDGAAADDDDDGAVHKPAC